MKATGSTKQEYEVCPKGSHPGRIFYILDLGTQQGEWKGTIKFQHKVRIAAELPNKLMKDGRPFAIGKDYNINLGFKPKPGKPVAPIQSPLRLLIEALTGEDCPVNANGDYEYDLANLMGKTAIFNVIHNENGKAKIKDVIGLMEGMTVPPAANEPFFFSLDPTEFDPEVFEKVSPFWQDIIKKSPEWTEVQKIFNPNPEDREMPPMPDDDQSIPF